MAKTATLTERVTNLTDSVCRLERDCEGDRTAVHHLSHLLVSLEQQVTRLNRQVDRTREDAKKPVLQHSCPHLDVFDCITWKSEFRKHTDCEFVCTICGRRQKRHPTPREAKALNKLGLLECKYY